MGKMKMNAQGSPFTWQKCPCDHVPSEHRDHEGAPYSLQANIKHAGDSLALPSCHKALLALGALKAVLQLEKAVPLCIR